VVLKQTQSGTPHLSYRLAIKKEQVRINVLPSSPASLQVFGLDHGGIQSQVAMAQSEKEYCHNIQNYMK
jgi:hypothetical protein